MSLNPGLQAATEEIEVRGHIVDSLILPKILDRILQAGGSFEIRECTIGSRRVDPSYARVAVKADSQEALDEILADLIEHGATPVHLTDAVIVPADMAGRVPGPILQHDQSERLRSGSPADGSMSPARRWIAGSRSIPNRRPPDAWR